MNEVPTPRDLDAERSILSGILVCPERFDELARVVAPEHLFLKEHRDILRAMAAVRSTGTEPSFAPLCDELARRGQLEDIGGRGYLAGLVNGTPDSLNLPYFATRVRERAEARDVVRALHHTIQEVDRNGAHADVLGPLVAALRQIDGRASVEKIRFQAAADAMAAPAPAEVVEGIAWAGCVTVLIGASSAGKSFIGLSLGAAIGWGHRWHGRRVARGSVAYLGFERDALGLRLRALERFHARQVASVYVLRAEAPLSPRVGRDGLETPSPGELAATEALDDLRDRLQQAGEPPIRLVMVDTARASLAGSEDSSEVVAAYLRALVRMTRSACPEAAVLVSHHAGWNDGPEKRRRERGSSAWRGNVDATIFVEAEEPDPVTRETPLTIEALKVRDGDRPAPLRVVRRVVDLGTVDEHGRPETSCVIDVDRHAEQRATRAAASEAAEARAFDLSVLRLIFERPDVATSIDRIRQALSTRKEAISAALARLLQRGEVRPPVARGLAYTVTPAGEAALSGDPKP